MHSGARRNLPANIDAEQALLGALLIKNDAMGAIPASFDSGHFFVPIHRMIYDEIARVHASGRLANPVTIRAALPSNEMIGDMTIPQYMARMAAEAVSIGMVGEYATTITFDAMRRGMILIGQQAEDAGYDQADESTFMEQGDALRAQFERVMKGLEGEDEITLADAADAALDATSDAYRGKGMIGVDFGFAPLMGLIGPAMPGQLIVIGGGTKQGKSSMIEQVVMGAAMNGHPVWVYSGEMQGEELAHRALSRVTDIQAWRQMRGKVSEAEYEKLMAAKRNAETWQRRVFLRDKPMNMTQIERAVENFSKRHPGGMAVIDHIGLVERDKATSRMTEQEFGPVITRSSKMLANKAGVPIFAAAQLKKNTFVSDDRKSNRATFLQSINRRPRFTDLIGACEKDANHVIIPFRAEPILEELKPSESADSFGDWESVMSTIKDKAEIILALSRHTRWPQRKEVGWNGPKTQFEDLAAIDQGRFL
ncbi:replicative DNA helicase [Pararhizobium sp.]|uniref:replicative DNA helicase n=1 Tax=Pararhizobium sp. TaxID=1977563 RepID=UPI002725C146|nr:DnaB-like helicase C-terminal domain-containing protein [Pararhizobium sp.]MDO9417010.1 DnaB-like helicase C-terminal domain-containing protein [Pararhizobium sp.]